MRLPRTPDFTRLNLNAGGVIATALTEHRVLVSMHDHTFFVIANTDDRDAARRQADDIHNVQEGLRPVYTILLTNEHLAALADGVDHVNVTVLRRSIRGGYRPAKTAIKVNGRSGRAIRIEHGDDAFTVAVTVALSSDLHTGDVYFDGTTTVYRALTDYNPETGAVACHIVENGWTPGGRDGALTGGPNNIVYRVDCPEELLACYRMGTRTEFGLRDVEPAMTSDLHTGDVFTDGTVTEAGAYGDRFPLETGLTIYMATGDFDPATGTIQARPLHGLHAAGADEPRKVVHEQPVSRFTDLERASILNQAKIESGVK